MGIIDLQERIEKLRERAHLREAHKKEIKDLFIKLKIAHDWAKSEKDISLLDKGLKKVETIYSTLEKMGVEKEFSTTLFLFGDVLINQEIVEQFV